MGRLQEFIIQTSLARRTSMYIGSSTWSKVSCWIDGFDAAMTFAFPDEISDLCGFHEWLIMRFDGPGNVGWYGLIQHHFGDNQNATQEFFKLFTEFRYEVENRSVKAILKDHYDYEIQRYGNLVRSRYFVDGWDKR
jgi:hypothetical protein